MTSTPTPTPTLWTQVASDTRFCLEAPTPEMVKLDDIFYSLAGQNRYNGHTRPRITVAEHSIRVAVIAAHLTSDADTAAHALVHDFHEAYAGDIISPVIRLLARDGDAYKKLVATLDAVIWRAIDIPPPTAAEAAAVRKADMLALELERTACLGPSPAPPGDGWPVHDEREVEAARGAWVAAVLPGGLRHFGIGNQTSPAYGWGAYVAEDRLRYAFGHLFPGKKTT